MSAFVDATFLGEVIVTLTVIMDPLGNVPLFLSLTAGQTPRRRATAAWQSVLTALGVITLFALFGRQILSYLGITVPALQGSGGLLLLLVALQLLTGREETPSEVSNVNIALVPLGTPLIAGPGAIVAVIVFVQRVHGSGQGVALALGILAVHIIIYLSLRFSVLLIRLLREGGIQLLTRVSGLLLSAIAVQLIADGVRGFVRA